MLLKHMAVGEL